MLGRRVQLRYVGVVVTITHATGLDFPCACCAGLCNLVGIEDDDGRPITDRTWFFDRDDIDDGREAF